MPDTDASASPRPTLTADFELLGRLRLQLGQDAERAGLIDVAYTEVDSPVGRLLLAATERGLVRVGFAVEGFDRVLGQLAELVSPRILQVPSRLDRTARQLDEYFAGTRTEFHLDLDRVLSKGFRGDVHRRLPEIGYGTTQTYREVAELVGRPKAVRAVGTACATNPLPVVVPCHRVLRSDGTAGGYLGGIDAKAALLELEARHVHND
nr:methylated-DNA--[protein]-cysteine S-methyltransferase [Gulosibacter faecalis]